MNFVKDEYFKLGERRFLILTGMVFLPEVEKYEKQVGNAVEFVEVSKAGVKNTTGEPLWVEAGTPIIKTKRYLYSLIEKKELELL